MRGMILMCTMAAVIGAAACHTGPAAEDFRPATTPRGVETRLELRGKSLRGELLEVRDSAFVLYDATGSGLVLVPFSAVRGARFEGIDAYGGGAPDAQRSARLRQISRYPYGMSPQVLDALLANAHQAALRVVDP